MRPIDNLTSVSICVLILLPGCPRQKNLDPGVGVGSVEAEASAPQAEPEMPERLLTVEEEGLVGLVDEIGRVVVEPSLEDAREYAEGLVPVKYLSYGPGGEPVDGPLWGYLDGRGEVPFPARFDDASPFRDGRALVSVKGADGGNEFNFIDCTGARICETHLDTMAEFREGRAVVTRQDAEGNYRSFVIDDACNVKSREYKSIAEFFSQGRVAVTDDFATYGVIDLDGEVIVPIGHERIGVYSEGLVEFQSGGRYGFLDLEGEVAIEPRFDWASPFHEGLARVWFEEEDRVGFIDTAGEIVIEPRFPAEVNGVRLLRPSFSEGLAPVADPETERIGYIDTNGAWVIPPTFEWAYEFADGVAKAKEPGGPMLGKYYGRDGTELCPELVVKDDLGGGLLWVLGGKEFRNGIATTDCAWIWPPEGERRLTPPSQ